MKPYVLIIYCLFLSLISNSSTAETLEKTKAPGQKVYGDVVVNEDIQKLLVVPGVQKVFDECKKDNSLAEIPNCIWKKLNAEQKKQVQTVYADEIKNKNVDSKGRSVASTDRTNLTGRTKTVGIDYASDPAVAALSEYFGKKLKQILEPSKSDLAKGDIVTVDHTKFIELYKSELGKTIISAFTSYCLDTDPSTCCADANDPVCKGSTGLCSIDKNETNRSKHKELNLKSLSKADMDIKGSDSLKWNKCIIDVTQVCYNSSSDAYSAERACVIVDYVKVARKNILIVDEQEKFYKDFKNNPVVKISSNMKEIEDEKLSSADAILEMTSKNVEDTLKASTAIQKKEMDACIDDNEMIADINACKKFLNTNKDNNTAAVTEFGLRQIAQEHTLEEELNSGDDKVKAYLKEEGFEAEIDKLTNKENIEHTKEQILERYRAEKNAIIKEMASRIEQKTVSIEGKISESIDDNDQSKLKNIKSQLNSRSTDMANLVKFNNIVSSYLSIEESDGKQSINTASLFAESKNLQGEEAKIFNENISNAKLSDKKNSPNLNVDTINKTFLNYKEDPKEQ